MHLCTNESVVQIPSLRDVRDYHSTFQYRPPTQTQKMIPSPMLETWEMK